MIFNIIEDEEYKNLITEQIYEVISFLLSKGEEFNLTANIEAVEFDDHFVISPTIQFSQVVDFSTNKLGQNGKAVKRGFEYNSGNNKMWLDKKELLKLI